MYFFPNYAFKTSPEMLLWRDYQHNAFENMQTQALNPNTIYLRSKHTSPRREWVPTLREPTSGKLRFPESLLRQPSMGQFYSKRWVPKSFNAASCVFKFISLTTYGCNLSPASLQHTHLAPAPPSLLKLKQTPVRICEFR